MWSLFRRDDPANVTGAARSPKWASFVKRFLRGKACLACGQKDALTGHHVVPFHLRPDLELDERNVVPLCSDRCHIVFGHFNDFRLDNPQVREDCEAYLMRRREAQKRCEGH
jgi:5-methylcytosine-specific restriction endonuclease McrA